MRLPVVGGAGVYVVPEDYRWFRPLAEVTVVAETSVGPAGTENEGQQD